MRISQNLLLCCLGSLLVSGIGAQDDYAGANLNKIDGEANPEKAQEPVPQSYASPPAASVSAPAYDEESPCAHPKDESVATAPSADGPAGPEVGSYKLKAALTPDDSGYPEATIGVGGGGSGGDSYASPEAAQASAEVEGSGESSESSESSESKEGYEDKPEGDAAAEDASASGYDVKPEIAEAEAASVAASSTAAPVPTTESYALTQVPPVTAAPATADYSGDQAAVAPEGSGDAEGSGDSAQQPAGYPDDSEAVGDVSASKDAPASADASYPEAGDVSVDVSPEEASGEEATQADVVGSGETSQEGYSDAAQADTSADVAPKDAYQSSDAATDAATDSTSQEAPKDSGSYTDASQADATADSTSQEAPKDSGSYPDASQASASSETSSDAPKDTSADQYPEASGEESPSEDTSAAVAPYGDDAAESSGQDPKPEEAYDSGASATKEEDVPVPESLPEASGEEEQMDGSGQLEGYDDVEGSGDREISGFAVAGKYLSGPEDGSGDAPAAGADDVKAELTPDDESGYVNKAAASAESSTSAPTSERLPPAPPTAYQLEKATLAPYTSEEAETDTSAAIAPSGDAVESKETKGPEEAVGYNGISEDFAKKKDSVVVDQFVNSAEKLIPKPTTTPLEETKVAWKPYQFDCATEVDDKGLLCQEWAAGGLCQLHKPTMFLFCRKTCLCVGPQI